MPSRETPAFAADVLWLNAKTPGNFNAGRDHEQANTIAMRAQHYSRWKREEDARLALELPNDTSPNPPAKTKTSEPVVGSSDRHESRHTDEQRDGVGKQTTPSHSKAAKRSPPGRKPARLTRRPERSRAEHSSSLTTPLQGGNSDPFGSTPVPLTPLRHSVVQTIRPLTVKLTFPGEMESRNGARVLFPNQLKFYNKFFTSEAAMQALFAHSWSVMARVHPHNKELYYRNALEHEVRGMRALRPLLMSLRPESPNVDDILQTVQALCSAAIFRSRPDAVSQHLTAMKEVITLVGGPGKLHWFRRDQLLYIFVRNAANTRSRPLLDPSTWDPGRWFDQPGNNLQASQEQPQISATEMSSNADTLAVIFSDLRDLAAVDDLKKQLMPLDSEADELNRIFRWSQIRRQAVRARILNHWCDVTEPTHAVDPVPGTIPTPTVVHHASVDMCLCLVAQMFIIFGLEPTVLKQDWTSGIQIWHIMLLRCICKLGFDLESIDASFSVASDLLWVCGTGAFVEDAYMANFLHHKPTFWHLYDADELDIRWFSIRFGVLARKLGYEKFEDVASLFAQRYVYIPSLQDDVMRRLFNSGWW